MDEILERGFIIKVVVTLLGAMSHVPQMFDKVAACEPPTGFGVRLGKEPQRHTASGVGHFAGPDSGQGL